MMKSFSVTPTTVPVAIQHGHIEHDDPGPRSQLWRILAGIDGQARDSQGNCGEALVKHSEY
ncbi:MAG TPA: hypothetical protein VN700_01855 [Vicinamibacterales bacterium]|nr:hypothetical protein [Vicinamibacterales bacterium]